MDDLAIWRAAMGPTANFNESSREFIAALREEAKHRTGFFAGPRKRDAVLRSVIAEAARNRKAILGD